MVNRGTVHKSGSDCPKHVPGVRRGTSEAIEGAKAQAHFILDFLLGKAVLSGYGRGDIGGHVGNDKDRGMDLL